LSTRKISARSSSAHTRTASCHSGRLVAIRRRFVYADLKGAACILTRKNKATIRT
jgi:hypothetical protein